MKTKLSLVGIAVMMLAASCAPVYGLPGEAVLKPGESIGDANRSIKITFVEVLGDSRCPADALCIWQGNVKVLIAVAYGTEIQQYSLTSGELLEYDVNSITVGEYTITLVQVDPYPLASQSTYPMDYQIALDIQLLIWPVEI